MKTCWTQFVQNCPGWLPNLYYRTRTKKNMIQWCLTKQNKKSRKKLKEEWKWFIHYLNGISKQLRQWESNISCRHFYGLLRFLNSLSWAVFFFDITKYFFFLNLKQKKATKIKMFFICRRSVISFYSSLYLSTLLYLWDGMSSHKK